MTSPERKLPAAEWLPFFTKANVLTVPLTDAQSAHAKSIKIGQFLSPNVDRPVPIQVNGRNGIATLRLDNRRAKTKLYFFEVNWTDEKETPAPHSPSPKTEEEATNQSAKQSPETSEDATDQTHPIAALKVEAGPKMAGGKVGSGNDEVWD